MANLLPPLPVGVAPGSSYWNDWYEKLRTLVNSVANSVPWSILTGTPTTIAGYGVTDVTSGHYTPTFTNVANLDASVPLQAQWLRIQNVVTVSGGLTVDPTSSGVITQLGISLPIASTLTNLSDCTGTANARALQETAAIYADTTNHRAMLQYLANDPGNAYMSYVFCYTII